MIEEKSLLSKEDAAAYLNVTEDTLRTYVSQGKLKRAENNGESGFLLADLEKYSEERRANRATRKAVEKSEESSEQASEAQLLTELIAHAFTSIPGINGLGRMTEVPRTWKLDVTTARGPESYRVTRNPDGSFQHECW